MPSAIALIVVLGTLAASLPTLSRALKSLPNVGASRPPLSPAPFVMSDLDAWQPDQRAAPYLATVHAAESTYDIPHNLLARLIQQESFWNPKAINVGSNAQGIAQIVPRWHPNIDPYNWRLAIPYAAGYLKENYQRFGTWPRALAAYNWGPGNVTDWMRTGEQFAALPRETQNYISNITGDVPV